VFTLIEILVAIVILGILFAILLPRLLRAREYARQEYCMNNMRQIGLGYKNYMNDYNGIMPVTHFWLTDFSPIYEYARDLKIFKCPSSDTPVPSLEDLYQRTEEEYMENKDKVDYYTGGEVKDIELSNSATNAGFGNNAYHFDMSNPGRITQDVMANKTDTRLIFEKDYHAHFNSFNVIFIDDLHYETELEGFTKYWILDDRGWIDTSLDPYPDY
jgi:prepilin-type N-terminal cleavage/methylation domain-containing protein